MPWSGVKLAEIPSSTLGMDAGVGLEEKESQWTRSIGKLKLSVEYSIL